MLKKSSAGRVSRNVLFRTGCLAGFAGTFAISAMAQGQDQQEPAQDASSLEEVIVTGFRGSLQSSAANKREQIAFTDSIFAEDIGKFPDINLAESLQRVPGVQIQRDVTGEG